VETLAALGTLAAGLVFLVLAYGNLNYERHRRSRGVVTQGVIVDSAWRINSVEAIYQAPEVEFVDQQGTTRRFEQPTGTSFRPAVGSQVAVWYDPAKPDEPPVLHEDTPTKMFPVIFGLVGLAATVVGVVLLVGALA
jgi:hypothetical protein